MIKQVVPTGHNNMILTFSGEGKKEKMNLRKDSHHFVEANRAKKKPPKNPNKNNNHNSNNLCTVPNPG